MSIVSNETECACGIRRQACTYRGVADTKLDTDWYEGTRYAKCKCGTRVVPGGIDSFICRFCGKLWKRPA